MKTRSRDNLERLWRKIWKRINEGAGYQPFGVDWPTLRIVKPLCYSALKSVMTQLGVPTVERRAG